MTGAGRRADTRGRGRCCSACATTARARRGRCGPRWSGTGRRPCWSRGRRRRTRWSPLAADEGMRPPVALLAHALDEPGRAAFWPFAEFSPEWVAIRWALEHGVPVRFIDLPGGPHPGPAGGRGRTTRRDGRRSRRGAATGRRRRSARVRRRADVRIDPLGRAGRGGRVRRPRALVGGRGRAPRAPGRRRGPVRRRSPRSPRRWARCARRTGTAATTGTRCARPTCGSGCGPRGGSSGTTSPWCAGPGTCPALRATDHRGRRPGAAQGAAQGEGGDDLGAVDAPPAVPAQRLRRGHRLAGLVRASVRRARTAPSSAG